MRLNIATPAAALFAAGVLSLAFAQEPPRPPERVVTLDDALHDCPDEDELSLWKCEAGAGAYFREYLLSPFNAPGTPLGSLRPPLAGLALAGGGSRAAPYAMGVLEALAGNGSLASLDLVSSVSGGGYSTFYMMSRLEALGRAHASRKAPTIGDLSTSGAFAAPLSLERCPEGRDWAVALPMDLQLRAGCYLDSPQDHEKRVPHFPQQAHVAYFQDLLAMDGSWRAATIGANLRQGAEIVTPHLLTTALTLVPGLDAGPLNLPFGVHHLSQTLFDWPTNTSPSADAYGRGIARAYGFREPRVPGEWGNDGFRLEDAERFSMPGLGELRERSRDPATGRAGLPYWIANASSGEFRYALGWFSGVHFDASRHVFEIGLDRMGSGEYGFSFVPGDASARCRTYQHDPVLFTQENPDARLVCPAVPMAPVLALDATRASAAFLDANQIRLEKASVRAAAALGQHTFNLNWGMRVTNYRVGDGLRALHAMLPLPLYYVSPLYRWWMDRDYLAPYVYLTDGGNAENLGLFALLRRGTKHAVVSDHAVDGLGTMEDICRLKNQLELVSRDPSREHALARRYVLLLPALEDLDQTCNQHLTQTYALHRTERGVFRAGPADSNYAKTGRHPRSQESPQWLCEVRRGRWTGSKCEPVWSRGPDGPLERGYSPHAWPMRVVTGCLLEYDARPGVQARPGDCPPAEEGREAPGVVSRLYLLKSAWDESKVERAFSGSRLLGDGKVRLDQCWFPYDWRDMKPGSTPGWASPVLTGEAKDDVPCEAALFWLANRRNTANCGWFPMNHTVTMTLNSSPTMYSALKDLGRWQAARIDPAGAGGWNALYASLQGENGRRAMSDASCPAGRICPRSPGECAESCLAVLDRVRDRLGRDGTGGEGVR